VTCPHFPACVGCPWIGHPYAEQLAAKRGRVVEALAAALPPAARPHVAPVVPAPARTGYRVQVKLVVHAARDGPLLGLYHPGTHRVADVTRCPLHERSITGALPVIRHALAAEAVPIHGAGRDGVRYLLVRASLHERRLLVTLVSSRVPLPGAARLARRLRAELPLAGLLLNENPSAGNVILGPVTHHLWGEATLRERYGDLVLAAGPTAFVQANTRMAARIYADLAGAAALRGHERVLDLYCGVGGVALTLAAGAAAVLGIEEVEAAVACARDNARRNRLRNANFEAGRVEELPASAGSIDLVTLNPPRKGCGEAVARRLLALAAPRILYLSCAPASFARDAAALISGGYQLLGIRPYDLMPQTDHVELLGSFARRAGGIQGSGRRDRHPDDRNHLLGSRSALAQGAGAPSAARDRQRAVTSSMQASSAESPLRRSPAVDVPAAGTAAFPP